MSSTKRPASSSTTAPNKKTKSLKQGTLFSFFGKKPSPTSNAATGATTSSTTSKSPAAVLATQSPNPNPPGSSTLRAPIKSVALWKQVSIGTRLEVYWPDDEAYYPATVTAQRSSQDGSVFTVSYDDGEVERLDLATSQFRLLKMAEEDDKKREASGKRRIQDDDDSEEEAEFDLEESEEDEESAYEQGNEEEEDEEEEEEHQWMVTDDDETPRKPAKSARFRVTAVEAPAALQYASKPKTPTTSRNSLLTPRASKPGVVSQQSQMRVTPPERMTPSPSGTSTSKHVKLPNAMPVKGAVNPAGSHLHNHLKFLQNPRDAQGRSSDHANYDSHTLKVDYRELERGGKKLTPASQQWWELKAQYYDTVLFFKTGKFYELYHMDADVGVQVLDFIYMKGEVAHAGFPEISYGVMADKLVRAGYKVARVEQTETPEMLKERKKQKKRGAPTPKVVNREVCSILTMGTRTFCYLDSDAPLLEDATGSQSSIGPLLAIREVMMSTNEGEQPGELETVQPVCEYGITLVDAARGSVTIGQFEDDVLRSRMNTLLTAYEPLEVLIEGGDKGASPTLLSLIRSVQATFRCACRLERIQPNEIFPRSTAVDSEIRRKMERKRPMVQPWNVEETLDEIHARGYYPRASRQQDDSRNTSRWPKVLHAAVEGNAKLALSSFGAVLFYLQRNLIDKDILGMNVVKAYVPPASSGTTKTSSAEGLTMVITEQDQEEDGSELNTTTAPASDLEFESKDCVSRESEINHLSLDGTTLQNLEVLSNGQTQTVAGSLWSKINFTKTPHGCRLLRAWLLRPLFRKADIDRRADAVEELISGSAAMAISEARSILAKCGDIERLLSRVHSMGAGATDREERGHHPNERAVLYEAVTHTKRKVGDFSKLLNGLRQTTQIPELFQGVDIKSGLLRKIVRHVQDGGCFPEMVSELDWYFDNFDCEKAARGLFEPSRGVDETYDQACDAIERIERDLHAYKDDMCANQLHPSQLAKSKWTYINTKVESKDKYLIELPASIGVPDDFVVKGKRGSGAKQVNKYRTPFVQQLVDDLEQALDIQKEGKALGMQLFFAKFDSIRHLWAAAAQATAMLDALGSLAQASARNGFTRANILDCSLDDKPCIRIVQGHHPCVDFTHNGGQFIPNDLALGGNNKRGGASSRVLLLSGPNMGGKSTLLRQTSLIVVLAQLGCFVPADHCSLTPVDRIYTRLGASDRILVGQSTFFVELAETASALRGATRRSLVVMDELGRGTSTFDGTAIASACVKHLIERNGSLVLFATHYHSLLEEWSNDINVRLGHMECLVEGDSTEGKPEEPDTTSAHGEREKSDHSITFLYTLGEGACPKSFGINVARLAGLPEEVLSKAKAVSSRFEAEMSGFDESSRSLRATLKLAIEGGNPNAVEKIWDDMHSGVGAALQE